MTFEGLFSKARAQSRIARALEITEVEYLRSIASGEAFAASSEAAAACSHLKHVASFREKDDFEGCWASLHAAQRMMIYSLPPFQIAERILVLKEESSKLTGWRKGAVEALLELGSVSALETALRIRDESSDDQYHKIWLTSDQFRLLMLICLAGLLAIAPLAWYVHFRTKWCLSAPFEVPPTWSVTMLLPVLGVGIWGGSFSMALSMFSILKSKSIPESVADTWATVIRAIYGGISGFSGYAFIHCGLFRLPGNGADPIAIALAVAFVFGYSGERLVAGIANSVGSNKAKSD